MEVALVLTCEHGGNEIPPDYAWLFRDVGLVLDTHRGLDIGILPFAQEFCRQLDEPLYYATVTRLLVDLNRSLTNRTVLSEFSRQLDRAGQRRLLENYYHPYRNRIRLAVESALTRADHVLHLTFHSFTHELDGQIRPPIALLYDSSVASERRFSVDWRRRLHRALDLEVRLNFPYRGDSDGQTTSLRKVFAGRPYSGICLEINQRDLVEGRAETWIETMVETFQVSREAVIAPGSV